MTEAWEAKERPKTAEHLLSAAGVLWNKVKDELKEKPGDGEKPYADSAPVPPEELRKVAKWFQQTVTKFGASAAVADGPGDPALKPVAEEVVKSFTAAQGTLLSMRRGAGPSMCQELVDVGSGLAETTNQLGAAVGTPNMAVCAGKALDRCKHLERISTQNRAATRRRLLTSLALLRDANRELSEALNLDAKSRGATSGVVSETDDDLADDLGDYDQELEPEERRIVEATVKVVRTLEEILKKASTACMPSSPSSSTGVSGAAPPSIEDLEAAVKHAALASGAVDGLAAHALGGLDVGAFSKSLKELRDATTALAGPFPHTADSDIGLHDTLDALQAALDDISKTAEFQDG